MNTKKAALTVLSIALKIVIYAVVIMGIYRLGVMAYNYGHSVFAEEAVDSRPGRTVELHVESGASVGEIAKLLKEKGLVEDWKLFLLQAKLADFSEKLTAGQYKLSTAMLPSEIMSVLSGEEIDFCGRGCGFQAGKNR